VDTEERTGWETGGDERGCGRRQRGGIYIEAGKCTVPSRRCRPIWDFLIDPPQPIAGLNIPNRGVMIRERPDGSGVYDVYDRVGEKFYPNVADFVEETRRMGLSRRLGANTDFDKLTTDSMIFLAHPKAIVTNADLAYQLLWEESDAYTGAHPWSCRCGKPDHNRILTAIESGTFERPLPSCVSLWWELVRGGDEVWDPSKPPRTVRRAMPAFAYEARHAPEGFSPDYEEGLFLKYRIRNLTVIKDPVADTHVKAVEKAAQSSLPISLEDA
jgi:hypothetical protein